MSCRDFSQPSFAEAFVAGYTQGRGTLEAIDKAFDWGAFEVLLSPIHGSSKGAPGYPPVTMLKIILLQQWYTLSDPAAEEAVRDRLSFRRFCGIPLDRETPDHASIWRFRQTIDKLGLAQSLLAEANRQLDARGLIIKSGTLVDATLIAAAVKRPYDGGGVNSGIRSGVERAPATMKRWYGMSRVRYLGLARNNCHLQCVAMAMNMKRALVLMGEA
jgi:transposase, IS5 family